MKTISYNVCVFWLKQADEAKVVLLVIKVTQGRLKQADEENVVLLVIKVTHGRSDYAASRSPKLLSKCDLAC